MSEEYVVWSNEHSAWWRPQECGYTTMLEAAGRYSRDDALGICIGARGGRRHNRNPSEVPVLYADAVLFWADDKPEWREERAKHEDYVRRQKYAELGLYEDDPA